MNKRPVPHPQRQQMTLDLHSNPKRTRLLKTQRSLASADILSSPDVQKLKLASPDLEKFITNPHSLITPTQVFFPRNVTEEQELYAKGFVDALAILSNREEKDSEDEDDDMDSDDSSLDVKPDISSSSSTASSKTHPIDMASQEKIKLERKRQRNRIAASKCRKRKLERIAKLEDKVKLLKNENQKLSEVLERLRSNVNDLKDKIMTHVNGGCQIMISE